MRIRGSVAYCTLGEEVGAASLAFAACWRWCEPYRCRTLVRLPVVAVTVRPWRGACVGTGAHRPRRRPASRHRRRVPAALAVTASRAGGGPSVGSPRPRRPLLGVPRPARRRLSWRRLASRRGAAHAVASPPRRRASGLVTARAALVRLYRRAAWRRRASRWVFLPRGGGRASPAPARRPGAARPGYVLAEGRSALAASAARSAVAVVAPSRSSPPSRCVAASLAPGRAAPALARVGAASRPGRASSRPVSPPRSRARRGPRGCSAGRSAALAVPGPRSPRCSVTRPPSAPLSWCRPTSASVAALRHLAPPGAPRLAARLRSSALRLMRSG